MSEFDDKIAQVDLKSRLAPQGEELNKELSIWDKPDVSVWEFVKEAGPDGFLRLLANPVFLGVPQTNLAGETPGGAAVNVLGAESQQIANAAAQERQVAADQPFVGPPGSAAAYNDPGQPQPANVSIGAKVGLGGGGAFAGTPSELGEAKRLSASSGAESAMLAEKAARGQQEQAGMTRAIAGEVDKAAQRLEAGIDELDTINNVWQTEQLRGRDEIANAELFAQHPHHEGGFRGVLDDSNTVDRYHGMLNDRGATFEQLKAGAVQAQAAQERLNKAQEIDPWRALKGTGNQIMAAVGVFLGGLASGMTGQQNQAMDFVMKAIDRDIEVQRLQEQKASRGAEAAKTAWSMMKERHADDLSRFAATRNYMLQQLSVVTQRMGLTREAAAFSERGRQIVYEDHARTAATKIATLTSIAQQKSHLNIANAEIKSRRDMAELSASAKSGTAPNTIGGWKLVGNPTKEMINQASVAAAALAGMRASIKRVIELRSSGVGASIPGSEKAKELNVLTEDLKAQVRAIYNFGAALSPAEAEALNTVAGGMGNVGFMTDKAQVLERTMSARVTEAMKVRGFDPDEGSTALEEATKWAR